MAKPPTVQLSFIFDTDAVAWDFMRSVDRTGGDALAGYPGLRVHSVCVVMFETCVDTIKGLAERFGGKPLYDGTVVRQG